MTDADTDTKGFSPPYNIPWATFLSTVERAANDLPNKIDRSYLESQAGSIQTYVIAAFKGFDLIGGDQRPTGLKRLAAEPDNRPAIIADMLRQHYGPIIALGETNATPDELIQAFTQAFPSVTGASRVKAIRFFLSAATYAGLRLSPLWKVPKAGGGGGGRRTGRRGSRQSSGPAATPANGVVSSEHSIEAMKSMYFDLLLSKAKTDDGVDEDVLNRIERLVGLNEMPRKRTSKSARKAADESPTTPQPGGQPPGPN